MWIRIVILSIFMVSCCMPATQDMNILLKSICSDNEKGCICKSNYYYGSEMKCPQNNSATYSTTIFTYNDKLSISCSSTERAINVTKYYQLYSDFLKPKFIHGLIISKCKLLDEKIRLPVPRFFKLELNNISYIDLQKFTGISFESVHLNDCPINGNISILNSWNSLELVLNNNNLTTFNGLSLPQLVSLRSTNNKLTQLSPEIFSTNSQLKLFYSSGTEYKSFDSEILTNRAFYAFEIWDNSLTEIIKQRTNSGCIINDYHSFKMHNTNKTMSLLPNKLFDGSCLYELVISTGLTTVSNDNFGQMNNLAILSLSENKLTFLPPNFMKSFPKLTEFNISHNFIASLSDNFVQFDNKVSFWPDRILDVSYNNLTEWRK